MKKVVVIIIVTIVFMFVAFDIAEVESNSKYVTQKLSERSDDNRRLLRQVGEINKYDAVRFTVSFRGGYLYYFEDLNDYMRYKVTDGNGNEYRLKYAIRNKVISVEELSQLFIEELKSVENVFMIDDLEYLYIYKSDDFNIYYWNCLTMCVTTFDIVPFRQGDILAGGFSSSEISKFHFEQDGQVMRLQEALDLYLLDINDLEKYGLYDMTIYLHSDDN